LRLGSSTAHGVLPATAGDTLLVRRVYEASTRTAIDTQARPRSKRGVRVFDNETDGLLSLDQYGAVGVKSFVAHSSPRIACLILGFFLPQSLLEQAPAPKTTHELIEELSSWETIESVRRGQSLARTLHSGAARIAFRARSTGPLHAAHSLESLVSAHEDALLAEARSRGHFGSETSDLAAFAILQHHGAATRFLDATTNLLVAAWFACSADKDDDGLLMLLDPPKRLPNDDR
jgi:hypothetical protein